MFNPTTSKPLLTEARAQILFETIQAAALAFEKAVLAGKMEGLKIEMDVKDGRLMLNVYRPENL